METIKKTENYTIYKKKSGRFAVKNSSNDWINGDEKVKILVGEKLLKVALPKKPEPEPESTPEIETKPEAEA